MKIYLGSKSPRRSDLLKLMGIDFDILDVCHIEHQIENEQPLEYSIRITHEKLLSSWNIINDNSLTKRPVICADTEVVYNNQILGKPESYADAYRMLSLYSNSSHTVITSVGVKYQEYEKILSATTKVYFDFISDEKINKYLMTGDYKDKSGAYGIKSYIGQFINRIDGCYYSVMGLPLSLTRKLLESISD